MIASERDLRWLWLGLYPPKWDYLKMCLSETRLLKRADLAEGRSEGVSYSQDTVVTHVSPWAESEWKNIDFNERGRHRWQDGSEKSQA